MKKIKIIYEDKYIIVVNKDSGVLSIGNDKNPYDSLYSYVKDYVKSKNKNNKIFIVHRLDKDTSGLMVFAKSEEVKIKLQNNWDNVIRKYYAVVHGSISSYMNIESYLKENKMLYTYSSNSGDYAHTEVFKVKSNSKYSLVDIRIYTGRKNQIRVHLSENGYPIVGDKKYGVKDGSKTMLLVAYYLEFIHPITKELLTLKLDIPSDYLKYFKSRD